MIEEKRLQMSVAEEAAFRIISEDFYSDFISQLLIFMATSFRIVQLFIVKVGRTMKPSIQWHLMSHEKSNMLQVFFF